jgi:hypothetical protein
MLKELNANVDARVSAPLEEAPWCGVALHGIAGLLI